MEKKTDTIYEAYMGDMNKDFTRKVRERIHWICNHVQGSRVLDVGCSQGITSILLGRENKNVIGLDVEQRCIDFANESLKTESAVVQGNVLFKQEDFISFKSEDSFFDNIVMTEVLEHVFNVEGFLEKAKHLLKVNGKLIVTVPFGINDFYDHKRTYYFYELYEKLQNHFLVEHVEFFGKWIGYICRNSDKVLNDGKVDAHYINSEEKAFFSIERGLVDSNKKLTDDLKKEKEKTQRAIENYETAKKWLAGEKAKTQHAIENYETVKKLLAEEQKARASVEMKFLQLKFLIQNRDEESYNLQRGLTQRIVNTEKDLRENKQKLVNTEKDLKKKTQKLIITENDLKKKTLPSIWYTMAGSRVGRTLCKVFRWYHKSKRLFR